jgi:hypothetical protein
MASGKDARFRQGLSKGSRYANFLLIACVRYNDYHRSDNESFLPVFVDEGKVKWPDHVIERRDPCRNC